MAVGRSPGASLSLYIILHTCLLLSWTANGMRLASLVWKGLNLMSFLSIVTGAITIHSDISLPYTNSSILVVVLLVSFPHGCLNKNKSCPGMTIGLVCILSHRYYFLTRTDSTW